jgi:DNA-binding NarL/FixJ family response regulator
MDPFNVKLSKALVVDDHSLFRVAFCNLLGDIFVPSPNCDQAINGCEALDKLHSKSYDVLFLDINMPELGGVELFKIMISEGIQIPTIVLSQYVEESLIRFFLQRKCCAYLTKNSEPFQVYEAVSAVLNGCQYVQPEVTCLQEQEASKSILCFTKRETMLLHEISLGLSSKEIAARMGLTQKTIETYRERLLQKTGTKNSAELLSYAFRIGSGF